MGGKEVCNIAKLGAKLLIQSIRGEIPDAATLGVKYLIKSELSNIVKLIRSEIPDTVKLEVRINIQYSHIRDE